MKKLIFTIAVPFMMFAAATLTSCSDTPQEQTTENSNTTAEASTNQNIQEANKPQTLDTTANDKTKNIVQQQNKQTKEKDEAKENEKEEKEDKD